MSRSTFDDVRGRRRTRFGARQFLVAAAASAAVASAFADRRAAAQVTTWTGVNTTPTPVGMPNFNDPTNWTAGVPTAGVVANYTTGVSTLNSETIGVTGSAAFAGFSFGANFNTSNSSFIANDTAAASVFTLGTAGTVGAFAANTIIDAQNAGGTVAIAPTLIGSSSTAPLTIQLTASSSNTINVVGNAVVSITTQIVGFNSAVGTGTTGSSLVKTGAGTLILTPSTALFGGANLFTGGLSIQGGTVEIVSGNALGGYLTNGTGAFNFVTSTNINGGTLRFNSASSFATSRGLTIGFPSGATAGAGTVNLPNAGNLTINGAVTGLGRLTVTGSTSGASLVLTNTGSNYSGGLTITGNGVVTASQVVALGSSPTVATANYLTLDGGTLLWNATSSTALASNRGVTIGSGNGRIGVTGTAAMTINSPIVGTGRLTVTGSTNGAAVVLAATSGSSYSGGLTITAGGIVTSGFQSNFGVPAAFAADNIRLDNGTLRYTDGGSTITFNVNNGITIGPGGGTISLTGSAETLVVGGGVTGDSGSTGSLTVINSSAASTNSATLRFTGTNTYAGPTVLVSGLLRDNGAHANAGSYSIAAGAVYGGNGTVSLANGGIISVGGTLSPGATLTGTTAVGTLTVNGAVNLFNGTSAGTLVVDVNPAAGGQKIDVLADAGALNITGSLLTFNVSNATSFTTPLVFAAYSTLTGTFANESAVNLAGFTIDYNYQGGNQIALTAVPEPASLGLFAVGGLALLKRRRRRNAGK